MSGAAMNSGMGILGRAIESGVTSANQGADAATIRSNALDTANYEARKLREKHAHGTACCVGTLVITSLAVLIISSLAAAHVITFSTAGWMVLGAGALSLLPSMACGGVSSENRIPAVLSFVFCASWIAFGAAMGSGVSAASALNWVVLGTSIGSLAIGVYRCGCYPSAMADKKVAELAEMGVSMAGTMEQAARMGSSIAEQDAQLQRMKEEQRNSEKYEFALKAHEDKAKRLLDRCLAAQANAQRNPSDPKLQEIARTAYKACTDHDAQLPTM